MTIEPNPTVVPPKLSKTPSIKVIGVGGAGLHAVEHIAQCSLAAVAFAGLHTDARLLAESALPQRLLLGATVTRGLGAGGDPDIGRAAAEMETAQLVELCAGNDLVIIVAGLGGGTGSGAAPVLARAARENGALVLGLVALPFDFEGARRRQQAQQGLRQLKTAADAVICLPNEKVAQLVDGKTTFLDTFKITNEMLAQGVRGLWCLLTRQGLINVDFADLCRVVRGRHAESCFATAEAAGENRAREVVEQLLASPMLDSGRLLGGADAVLVSLAGGLDLTLKEVGLVMEQINRCCENAQVVMGAAVDAAFNQRLSVTLIAAKRNQPETEKQNDATLAPSEPEPPASEFPTSALELDTQHLSQSLEDRPASRFAAPAPELTAEQTEQLLTRQARDGGRRRRKPSPMRQQMLPLEVVSKGRFAKSEPTTHQGEDLDTPTYIRKGVALN